MVGILEKIEKLKFKNTIQLAIQALEVKPSYIFGNRMTSAKVVYQLKELLIDLEKKNN